MKKLLPAFCLFLSSCVTTKTVNDKAADERQLGRETTSQLLVVKRDGTRIIPTSIKFPNYGAVKTDDNFLWVDGKKIFYRDMNAYQNEDFYTVLFRNDKFKNGKDVKRYRKGKINFYVGIRSVDLTQYLFDKNDRDPDFVTYETFSAAIADNPEALTLFHTLFPKKKIPNDTAGNFLAEDGSRAKLTTVVDFYNR